MSAATAARGRRARITAAFRVNGVPDIGPVLHVVDDLCG
jgi:hypothetical protein